MVLIVTLTAFVVTTRVYMLIVALIRPGKARAVASLAGGLTAGCFEIGVDAAASSWGLWHYPGYPSFGPLGFYFAAAIGYAALGLISWRLLRSRLGWRAVAIFLLVLGIYGPIRDRFAGKVTGVFEIGSGLTTHLMDAAFLWILPTLLVLTVIQLTARPKMRS